MMVIKHENLKLIVLMIVAYVIFIWNVVTSMPLHTSTDELGGIVSAASLAGLDWSGVIDTSGYYGFGWYSLFFWIFKLTDSPIIIYRTIITITAFLRVLIIPLAFKLGKNYLGIHNEFVLYSSAFLMPFLHTTTVGIISNEYILGFMIWLIIYLGCKLYMSYDNKKEKYLIAILLTLACLYVLFIHTRAVTLIIALILTFLVVCVVEKKDYLTFVIILGIPIGYFISKKIIAMYQMSIWGIQGNELRNASVSIAKNFDILDKDTWDVWIHMIIGLISTETIITGGMFIISITVFLGFVISVLFYKEKFQVNVCTNIMLSISVMCIGATILAFLVSGWFTGMLSTWGEDGAGKLYSYKGLAYVRYFDVYVPPFILACISLVDKINLKRIISIATITIVIFYSYYIKNIIPIIKENSSAASFMFGISAHKVGEVISDVYYYKCMILSLLIIFGLFVISHSKYKRYALCFVIVLMVMSHVNETRFYNNDIKDRMSSKILASYEEKCSLEKEGIYIDNIYLNDMSSGTDGNWKIYSIAQFYFNRYTVSKVLPEFMNDNDVIISTARSTEIEDNYEDLYCYILDDNEVWYTKMELVGYEPVLE